MKTLSPSFSETAAESLHGVGAPMLAFFDSGAGATTVQRAAAILSPKLKSIVIQDPLFSPYGTKDVGVVLERVKIAAEALNGSIPTVLACHTASVVWRLSRGHEENNTIIDIFEPTCAFAGKFNGRLAVLSTPLTATSGLYSRRLGILAPWLDVREIAAPGLASEIQKGKVNSVEDLARSLGSALDAINKCHPTAILLACTHYPLKKALFEELFQHRVIILDPSPEIARSLTSRTSFCSYESLDELEYNLRFAGFDPLMPSEQA